MIEVPRPAESYTVRGWMSELFSAVTTVTLFWQTERGEDAAQSAYKEALNDNNVPAYIRTMLEEQKQELRASHDKIKALRDAAK